MRTFLAATEDTTIYQRYPTSNAGLDEILEVGKLLKPIDGESKYATASARILINFDVPSEKQYPSGSRYYLNLRIANAKNVNRYQQLEVYPISRSWTEGSGYFYQTVKNAQDGATWSDANKNVSWSVSGSDYVSSTSSLYTFSKVPIEDVKIDITNLVFPVVSGSTVVPWNGLLIKFPNSDENDYKNTANIKFFSGNTHTVFAPKLEVVWDDQVFITGSLKPILSSNLSILPRNLKEAYTQGEKDIIRLVVRDQYPDKRFDAVQRYRSTYYLPSESFYRIRDTATDVILYDFDQYSKLNCDLSGSYFTLDTSFLEINRYYTIDLKVKSGQLVFFPEFNYTFKVDADD